MTSPSGRPPGSRRGPNGLTLRQEQLLRALGDFVTEHGYPPSMRELGQATGLKSTSSVSHQVHRLEYLGLLAQDPNRPRAYALTPKAALALPDLASDTIVRPLAERGPVTAPLLGQIAAGTPILSEQLVEDLYTIPPQLAGAHDPAELFVLTVRGDSMTGGRSPILDGDLVVVRRQQTADPGDVVAAMIDGESTVKRFQLRSGTPWLDPDNRAYQPLSAVDAVVLGRVIAVMRGL